MTRLTPAKAGRKEQLAYRINQIFIVTGIIFLIHDYFTDYLVDGYWSAGSLRLVELIVFGVISIILLRSGHWVTAKLFTSISLSLIFFVTPVFITLNHLEMYYINTLLLPVIVLIPSLVFTDRDNNRLILFLFLASLGVNFICEQLVFRYKMVSPADLEFYNYHFVMFSMSKIFTSLFMYVNVTQMFRQNELFESQIVSANQELKEGNELIQSQKQRIEEQVGTLEANAERLKELDTAKSNFFANISHEFRTPLTLLLGPLQDEVRNAVNPNDKQRFSVMKRNASRLLNLVNQLLDLSKLESGSMKLQARHTDLGPVIHQWVSQFGSIAQSRKIEFKVEIPEGIKLWLDVDKAEKIFMNLLANAFKFTPEGGVVSLVVRKADDGGNVEVEVSDSGIGIEAESLGKIFDRFYQVNDTSKREYGGTGIGLALVKELTEAHHGTIRVHSTPGQGSVFTVKLPLGNSHLALEEMAIDQSGNENGVASFDALDDIHDRPAAAQSLDSPQPERDKQDERPLVLIVEDSPDLQEYLARGLVGDYRISKANDGQDGIDLAMSDPPDLIVSDLMMPRVDGISLMKKIKLDERTSHIPVILLTAKADSVTKLEGIETGADDYIAKPFDMLELKARIQNLIDGRRKLRAKFAGVRIVRPNDIKVESVDDRFMKKVLSSVENHLSDDSYGVNLLAEEVSMSSVQVYRKVKALTGTTPNDLIRNMRLDRAKILLDQRAGNVSEVALQTGFKNMSYFAKCFKERFGINPSEIGS